MWTVLPLLALVAQVAVVEVAPEAAPLGPGGMRVLDLKVAANSFYSENPDLFDTLVLWPDFDTGAEDGAVYEPVSNATAGINFDQGGKYPQDYDVSADYGSAGVLRGVVVIGSLAGLAEAGALDVVAGAIAHQYGAMVSFIPTTGGPGHTGLLGEAGTHWSFFVDTGGSVLGGNRWEDLGDGTWRTGAPGGAYAPLDLYLMGLMPAEEVPPIRYMPAPAIVSPSEDPRGRSWSGASPPTKGVIATGTWEEVTVAQVVKAEGERIPEYERSSPDFRHAWAIVTIAGRPLSEPRRIQVEQLFAAWPAHFDQLTEGRGQAIVGVDGAPPASEESGCDCDVGRRPGWLLRSASRRR